MHSLSLNATSSKGYFMDPIGTRRSGKRRLGFAAILITWGVAAGTSATGATFTPAAQQFRQEVAHHFRATNGLPTSPVQVIAVTPTQGIAVLSGGVWYGVQAEPPTARALLQCPTEKQFAVWNPEGDAVTLEVPWRTVRQVVYLPGNTYVFAERGVLHLTGGRVTERLIDSSARLGHGAVSRSGHITVATSAGLHASGADGLWAPVRTSFGGEFPGTGAGVTGLGFHRDGGLWCTSAGAAFWNNEASAETKRLGQEDGLPWNEFTCLATGPAGEVWFGTKIGAIRHEAGLWHYRQGQRWLIDDRVTALTVDGSGNAWIGTESGLSCIERRPMTLAAKAEFYEGEIERHIKRTPYGFVAEAHLRRPAERASADPQDSDNDGLWTAMYGAGECFGYAATGDPKLKARAHNAFSALRFLHAVTQGGDHSPPPGYVARTIRPVEWADPNAGSVERDREGQKSDRLWKVLDPRWPRSADGQWFWKADTSSDELDGHYFFYPLYFDLCAETPEEKDEVRHVVRALTDHLIEHGFRLVDHDGAPTRWGIYDPESLNYSPDWWAERGLKSLSLISYLAVAAHITGDERYVNAALKLINEHAYAQNAMYPKVQHGPGSGNQSDDEMAVMCFYHLLRYSKDERLKAMIRISFYRYWCNEQPEMNPFFNFAYAAQCLGQSGDSPFGSFSLSPWETWHSDAMRTLYGLPLDRLNWGHRNSHRLDVVSLAPVKANDFREREPARFRGSLRDGKVLPVENRHFNHWNTDPWRLDYGGHGQELAAGTVFLLPYYLGLYHGFIDKP